MKAAENNTETNFQIPKDVEEGISLSKPKNKLIKEEKPIFDDFKENGIVFRVQKDEIFLYELGADNKLSPIKAIIGFKKIFDPTTRNKIYKFIRSQSDETTFPKEDIHKLIDNFYEHHQKMLNLSKNNELKKSKENADKKKLDEQKQKEYEKFEAEKPDNILDLVQGKIVGKNKDGKPIREMSIWQKLFDTYSFNNIDYGRITIHLLIGQQIIDARLERLGLNLDPRISVMYFKSSGTGKQLCPL